ncbi:hypothetical protein [Sphingobium phenoxybenzoativorans]|uniref:hypothetical protein n=1 Tax=Sphingobium phenoxybenzoativorans TaxID=1592790 RepID=UPI001112F7ED|nr:hypothetical protein [Sphingobium phenoxybenzoativorans]
MLYEIDQEILEKNYILPKLSEWMKLVGKLNLESASGMSKFLTATFDSFDISARDGHIASYRVNNGKACMFFSRIDSIYSEARIHEYFFEDGRSSIFGDINKFIREEKSKCEVIKIIREKLRSRNREDDEFVRVDGGISRCNWLIKTEMPKRLENIRKSISALHKKISDNEVSRAKVSRDIMAPLSFD